MTKKKFLVFLLTLFSYLIIATNVFAETSIVHEPFKTDLYPEGEIHFEQENKKYASVNFILVPSTKKGKNEKFIIDQYKHDGSSPHIESVFFYPVYGMENIFVIVSWSSIHKGEGVHGKFYEIYSYYKNDQGHLIMNENIKSDMNLRGFDGYMNSGSMNFDYKTAFYVKQYLRNFYSKQKEN